MPSQPWTRDELLVAINLYCKIPFGRFHDTNPDVVSFAERLRRTPGSLSMKLSNFASFDPTHKQRNVGGLKHASRLDKEVWDEFNSNWERAAYESQEALKRLGLLAIEDTTDEPDIALPSPGKTEAERKTRVRLVQSFFRRAVLVSYKSKCSFCGIGLPQLLIASHIIPWKDSVERRADPHNGICLCALHDRAFDCGLLGIGNKHEILVSRACKTDNVPELHRVALLSIEGRLLLPPYRFAPDHAAILFHRERIFDRT